MDKPDKLTILVVEDNSVMRKALLEALKLLNYNAIEAANGMKAIEIIESSRINGSSDSSYYISLIMSDLSMPEMDGQELFYALKKKKINIPVVMLTGDAVSNEMDRMQKDGLSGWLMKPVDIDKIAELLRNILN